MYAEANDMKKILAVFLAVLMVFTGTSVALAGVETEVNDDSIVVNVTPDEENGTRNIQNEDGLVFPINFTQLKFSFLFKIVEKIVKFFLALFGGDEVDEAIASGIKEGFEDAASAIEEGSQFIDDNS